MQTTMICPACGETIAIELPQPSDDTQACPTCGQTLAIPSGIAELPTPQIPGQEASTLTATSAVEPDSPGPDDAAGEAAHGETSARMIPWMVSGAVHLAVALLLTVLIVISIPEPPENINPPFVGDQSKIPAPMTTEEKTTKVTPVIKPTNTRISQNENQRSIDTGASADQDMTIGYVGVGIGDTTPGWGEIGGWNEGGDPWPPAGMFGNKADCVVYIIDRSGSMHGTFDDVEYELRRSITSLIYEPPSEERDTIQQQFYVILFAADGAIEISGRSLVDATEDNKKDTLSALDRIEPMGKTDPIPALERAFAALKGVSRNKTCAIELLTDGSFPDNAATLAAIEKLNGDRRIQVNTVLYGNRPVEAEAVLNEIATRNGGSYKYVSPDEL
jgi:hypothetical protein